MKVLDKLVCGVWCKGFTDDCHEGDGSTGVFAPDEEIDEETDPEDN